MALSGWNVWIFARGGSTNPCFSYIICLILYKQDARLEQLVRRNTGNPWDLGSNPRSPLSFNIFSINLIPCRFNPEDHHTTPDPAMPRIPWSQSNGQDSQPMMCCSQHVSMLPWKVNQAKGYWAWMAGTKPPLGINTPLGFASIVFYYLLLLFV